MSEPRDGWNGWREPFRTGWSPNCAWLAAQSIDQANAVLQEFMPRYNAQFAVPAERPEPAYRAWDEHGPLNEDLCFKHLRRVDRDNTVKHQWRTLQLLPSAEHPSYAGEQVEVLEHTDGRLQVRYQGDIIPCRQAPPRPGALRAAHGALAPTPEMGRIVKRLGKHGLSQHKLRRLANLEPAPVVEGPVNGDGIPGPPARRGLTPRRLASPPHARDGSSASAPVRLARAC